MTANATVLFWFIVWAISPGTYDQTDETLYWKQHRIRGVASTEVPGIWASTKTLDKNNMKYCHLCLDVTPAFKTLICSVANKVYGHLKII